MLSVSAERMFQYSNGGYRDHAPRQQDNSNVYRGPHTGADKENLSVDAEDYYPTRDADHYQQNFQNYEVTEVTLWHIGNTIC